MDSAPTSAVELIEATLVQAGSDIGMNAIRVEVRDPNGGGIRFLLEL